jgi:hypothetical protein
LWRKYFPAEDPIPFVMVDTWNDHEEGTAVEDGIPSCGSGAAAQPAGSDNGKAKPLNDKELK